MTGCSAFGCSNRSEQGYRMKVFPRDPRRRALWALKVRRKNWIPKDRSSLCEVHFDADQWEKDRVDGKRKLKCNAVPTIFDFTPKDCEREPPIDRSVLHNKRLKDENVSNSGTLEEPTKCNPELNEIRILSVSSQENCKASDPDVTSKNNDTCRTETQKEHSISDVFLNNAVDGLRKISAQESNLSKFTVFGLHVASQLQQMPLEEAYKLKEEIQNILDRYCPQSLKEPSFFSYKPQNKDDNIYCDLQSKLPIIKYNEKDKNQSTHFISPHSVTLPVIVLPSTTLNSNSFYQIHALNGSSFLNAVYF